MSAVLTRESRVGRPVLPTIHLNNGEHATLRRLDRSWIGRMLDLQATDQSGNTLVRDAAHLEKLFARDDAAFGIVTSDGRLIAQATMRGDMNMPERLHDVFNVQSRHALIGCVIVDPEYKKQGLCNRLIAKCVREAVQTGHNTAYARILKGNEASMHVFHDRFGFRRVAEGQSEESTAPRIVDYVQLKLR